MLIIIIGSAIKIAEAIINKTETFAANKHFKIKDGLRQHREKTNYRLKIGTKKN